MPERAVPSQSGPRLSPQQAAVLRTIHRMELSNEEVGHDLEGDLSICTGNLPWTEVVLERRGLLTRELVPEGLYVPEGYYLYRLTDAGREAVTAHVFRASTGDPRVGAHQSEDTPEPERTDPAQSTRRYVNDERLKHWLGYRPYDPGMAIVISSETTAQHWRDEGMRVVGPFVPCDDLLRAAGETP